MRRSVISVFLLAHAGSAQSHLASGPVAVAASGTYVQAVSRSSGGGLDGLGARAVSLDASYGPLSLGGAVAVYREDSAIDLSAGYHLARDPERRLATTFGAAVQLGERGEAVVPWVSHSRLVLQRPGLAVVPEGSLGIAVTRLRDLELTAVASGAVSLLVGTGRTQGVVTPAVSWARGVDDVVSAGVSVGVVRGLGRR